MIVSFPKNRGRLFRHLRSMSSTNPIPELIHHNNTWESDPVNQCDLFNSYFNSVYTHSDFSFSIGDQSYNSNNISEPFLFTEADVYNVLISLDPSKAQGIDGIGPAVLKAGAVPLSDPLSHL